MTRNACNRTYVKHHWEVRIVGHLDLEARASIEKPNKRQVGHAQK